MLSTWADHIVIHPDGSYIFRGSDTLTGSFEGSAIGTCNYHYEGHGTGTDFGTDGSAQCDGG